jgi:hypothetical protein
MNKALYIKIAIVYLLFSWEAGTQQRTYAEQLPSAFNGKDLTGWQVPPKNIWWHVEQGTLQVNSGPDRMGSKLWTELEYENFIMEFDFKFGQGVVDSGVFLRSDSEQIQIGISGSLKRDMTASPYIAGKGYPVEANGVAKLIKQDDWNTMTIVAKGRYYAVWLNGSFVMSYESDSALKKGPIGLQLHPKNEMSIGYRNIRIGELD